MNSSAPYHSRLTSIEAALFTICRRTAIYGGKMGGKNALKLGEI